MFIQNAVYKAVPTDGLTFPLAEGTVITVGDVTGIVPENIALAAPTGLIYLATGGTIDLTSEANAGVTFTDEQLNELGGDFNFIPVTEAGGSSLPSYSSSDIGKVLTVGEASPVETEVVVVPEQSVTYEGDAVLLSNAEGVASLNDGTSVVLSVNGQRYEGTLVKGNIRVEFETNKFYQVYKGKGTSVYFEAYDTAVPGHEGDTTPIRGTYTISATAVQSVTPSTTTVIVPEQTVTIVNAPAPLTGDASAFIEGREITAHVGDFVGVGVIGEWVDGGFSLTDGTKTYIFDANGDDLIFFCQENGKPAAGTYTVSLIASIPKAEPKWEAAGGGIFKISPDMSTGALDKNYTEIKAAITEGLLPVMFVGGGSVSIPIVSAVSENNAFNVYGISVQQGSLSLIKWSALLPNGPLTPAT